MSKAATLPKYRYLIVEQRVTYDGPTSFETWKHIAQISQYGKPGMVLRSNHYRQALDQGEIMQGIWGADNHPVRVRAQKSKGEDVLTLADVARLGKALHTIENAE